MKKITLILYSVLLQISQVVFCQYTKVFQSPRDPDVFYEIKGERPRTYQRSLIVGPEDIFFMIQEVIMDI